MKPADGTCVKWRPTVVRFAGWQRKSSARSAGIWFRVSAAIAIRWSVVQGLTCTKIILRMIEGRKNITLNGIVALLAKDRSVQIVRSALSIWLLARCFRF